MSPEEFREYLAEECRKAGGQNAFAARTGVVQSYLSQVLSGRQDPGPSFCKKVGARRVVKYELMEKEK